MMARAAKRRSSTGEVGADGQLPGVSAGPSSEHMAGSGPVLPRTGGSGADDDGSGGGVGGGGANSTWAALQPPRKRKRRVVSCAECHRRKQKCDRNMPCRACIERKMEASCHYETVAMSRERHHMRVIEAATYGRALQAGGNIEAKTVGFGYAQSSINSLGFLHKIDGGTLAAPGSDDVVDHGDSLGSLASMVSEPSGAAVPSSDVLAVDAQQPYYHAPQSISSPTGAQPTSTTTSSSQDAHHLVHARHTSYDHQHLQRPGLGDAYGTADKYRAFVRELPPRAAVDRLVAVFFREFNWNYYAIDEDVFYKQLADWNDLATGPFGSLLSPHQLSPDMRAFPALLFNVIATSLMVLEPGNEDHVAFFDSIKHTDNVVFEDLALDYSEAGMGILSILGKRQMSYTTVLAAFTRCAFLKYAALITEAWHAIGSAIHDAQEIGLHRTAMDPKPRGPTAEAVLENQWEIERRRRLWMILVGWDLKMGVVLGRPVTVDAMAPLTLPVDCRLPQTFADRSAIPVQPRGDSDPPTALSRAIWAYHTIAQLREVLALEKEGPCPRDFARVDTVHAHLVELEARTPAFFRLENPDTRFDDSPDCEWLRSQRASVAETTIFNFMALHRPYIFTRKASRTEALKACIRMLQVQRLHFASLKPQQYKTFSLFFGTFDSLVLMAAIYILFPREHPELLPEAIQHYRWSVDRFEIMKDYYGLAHSALGVLHAIYLRLRKTLGISFLENAYGLSGAVAPGSAPVDALTLSNIDPSLKEDGPVLAASGATMDAGRSAGTGTGTGTGTSTATDPDGDRTGGKPPGLVSATGGASGDATESSPPTGPVCDHGTCGSASAHSGQTPGDMSTQSGTSTNGSDVFSTSMAAGRSDTPTTEQARAGPGPGVGADVLPTEDADEGCAEVNMSMPAADDETALDLSLLDPQLAPSGFGSGDGNLADKPDTALADFVLPDNFDWSSVPPICPTGDLAYNILLGVSDGSAAAAVASTAVTASSDAPAADLGATAAATVPWECSAATGDFQMGMGAALLQSMGHGSSTSDGGDDGDGVGLAAGLGGVGASDAGAKSMADAGMNHPSIDGTAIPWQFEGAFGENSLWGLLNNYTTF